MQKVELVADGDVISYMFKRTPLGEAYLDLIDSRRTGITLLAVSESRQGVGHGNWGAKRLHAAVRVRLEKGRAIEARGNSILLAGTARRDTRSVRVNARNARAGARRVIRSSRIEAGNA